MINKLCIPTGYSDGHAGLGHMAPSLSQVSGVHIGETFCFTIQFGLVSCTSPELIFGGPGNNERVREPAVAPHS